MPYAKGPGQHWSFACKLVSGKGPQLPNSLSFFHLNYSQLKGVESSINDARTCWAHLSLTERFYKRTRF